LVSENRAGLSVRNIISGLALQMAFAGFCLSLDSLRSAFALIGRGVMLVQNASLQGAQFVFGYLGGGAMPFEVKGNTFIFFFQALPTVFVIGALSALFFHYGILQKIVSVFAKIFQKTLGLRGALALCSGAKMFLGQTDAPLVIRPYLSHMTRSEMCAIMSMGMATTSVVVMGLYMVILEPFIPNVMMHLITSTVMAVPISLSFARIVIPASSEERDDKDVVIKVPTSSAMEAISSGMYQAKDIVVGISLSLIVFIAFMFLLNAIIGNVFPGWSLERVAGLIFAPLACLLGFSWENAMDAGKVLGFKCIFNEIFAFNELVNLTHFTMRDRVVLLYAVCGFANIASVGIVVAAWNAFVPKVKKQIPGLVTKALLIGFLASFANAITVRLVLDILDVFAL